MRSGPSHAASTQVAPLAMAPKEQDINVVTFDELFASLDDPLDLI